MEKMILFDYGHGGHDSGATLGGRYEKNDVLKIGQDVKKIVEKHGVKVDETRKSDIFVPLQSRCDISNQKDYDASISFHRNAFNNQSRGVETYTYTSNPPKAVMLAEMINDNMSNAGFINRGVKSANFKVLRSTKTTAVLLEIGFIDNKADNVIFDTKYSSLVIEISKGILKYLGIKYISDGTDTPSKGINSYRVITGSFKDKENATKRVEQLKIQGFDSFIDVYRG